MKREDIVEFYNSIGKEISDVVFIFEPEYFDDAIIGFSNSEALVYNYQALVEIVMREQELSEEDAIEFVDFNLLNSIPDNPMNDNMIYPIVVFNMPIL